MFSQGSISHSVHEGRVGGGEYPPPDMTPATYAQQAGGMHPTGMIFVCFVVVMLIFKVKIITITLGTVENYEKRRTVFVIHCGLYLDLSL